MAFNQRNNITASTITDTNPEDFGRDTVQKGQIVNVTILGHNNILTSSGKLPNSPIVSPLQSFDSHMGRSDKVRPKIG